ncbi:hypothetical protein HDU93_004360 [Gonapodya sp. JEL0774]|nr:hypothetical protein HDU93_004360 [Gonapodya sp. JEL0774]
MHFSEHANRLADNAHALGKVVALKNCGDLLSELVPWFDFGVVEQCVQYNECGTYTPFIAAGKAVFDIEYSGTKDSLCAKTNPLNIDAQLKALALSAPVTQCRTYSNSPPAAASSTSVPAPPPPPPPPPAPSTALTPAAAAPVAPQAAVVPVTSPSVAYNTEPVAASLTTAAAIADPTLASSILASVVGSTPVTPVAGSAGSPVPCDAVNAVSSKTKKQKARTTKTTKTRKAKKTQWRATSTVVAAVE